MPTYRVRTLRNTDFSAATLVGANVEAMDWFNAEGFVPAQLNTVDSSTLERCPKDSSQKTTEVAFRARLAKEYGFQWEQFSSDDLDELESFWTFYSKPGGLCEQVDSWLNLLEKR